MTGHVSLASVLLAAVLAAPQPASAQKSPASQQKAAAAQQKGAPPTTKADTKADTKAGATKAGATKAGATKAAPSGTRPALEVAPESAARPRVPVILREVFTYDREGRRDPFVTLLTSDELRPAVADLRLVGVLLDPVRPIAVMRELGTNTQYRVTTGMKIGRMKVAMIKRRSVIFSIEEFGLNRLDSIVLGDTTKARAR